MLKYRVYFIFASIVILIALNGCSSGDKKRNLVVNTALNQVGVKYKSGNHSPTTGFDCSGLVYYSYKAAGYNIPRTAKLQYKYSKKVWFYKKPGDLLFFNVNKRWWSFSSKNNVNHVGIYIGNNKMVHAPKSGSKVSVVINVLKNRYWRKYYINTRRIIN